VLEIPHKSQGSGRRRRASKDSGVSARILEETPLRPSLSMAEANAVSDRQDVKMSEERFGDVDEGSGESVVGSDPDPIRHRLGAMC
jgi:hypothetical protein